jgi:crossover junction endodeoxyribonuclease RuvC
MEYIIGIDPGITGAVAVLKSDLSFCCVWDMPTLQNGKHHKVNAVELGKFLSLYGQSTSMVYLENVASMPGQGVASVFSFGRSLGVIEGVVGALQIPMTLVTPQGWKKRAGLLHTEKDMARTKAQQFYPAADLARKKDIGRADAILIARFGHD